MSQVSLFNFNLRIITLAVICKGGVWVARAVRCEILFNRSLDKVAAQETSLGTNPVARECGKTVQVSFCKQVSVSHLHLS